MKNIVIILFMSVVLLSCHQQDKTIVRMETSLGNIRLCLYDETVLHRENFLKLVREGYYNGFLFHRVINHFMIQTGDPQSRMAPKGMVLGDGDAGYTLKPEFNLRYYHKRGALAAARESDNINPGKNSSGSHFYIVQGKVYTVEELNTLVGKINKRRFTKLLSALKDRHENEILSYIEKNDSISNVKLNSIYKELECEAQKQFSKKKFVLSPEQIESYTTIGGTPHLDGEYTVFGEVIEGMDVVDKISRVAVDGNDRPLDDVVIHKMIIE